MIEFRLFRRLLRWIGIGRSTAVEIHSAEGNIREVLPPLPDPEPPDSEPSIFGKELPAARLGTIEDALGEKGTEILKRLRESERRSLRSHPRYYL